MSNGMIYEKKLRKESHWFHVIFVSFGNCSQCVVNTNVQRSGNKLPYVQFGNFKYYDWAITNIFILKHVLQIKLDKMKIFDIMYCSFKRSYHIYILKNYTYLDTFKRHVMMCISIGLIGTRISLKNIFVMIISLGVGSWMV